MKAIGKSWSGNGRLDEPRERWSVTEKGQTGTTSYVTLFAGWRQGIPKPGAEHPQAALCKLKKIECEQIDPGTLCRVTLQWEQDEPDPEEDPEADPTQGVPTTEVSENGTVIEVDIRQHPKFWTDWSQHWDFDKEQFKSSAPAYLKGVTKYVVGSSQVSVTQFFRGKPADVQGSLGKRENPPGFSQGGHWLVVGGGRSKQGPWWTRTLVYQYSSTAVPTQIYDA
jgi:hypothetical protein